MSTYKILAINPGSTSTKIAVYENETQIMEKTLRHSTEEINKYEKIFDQFEFRKNVIVDALSEAGIAIEELDAVVGRGGLLKPIKGGTYEVSDELIAGLKEPYLGEHASNLGGIIAKEIADAALAPSFIVDPVVVDEMNEVARISGMPEIPRFSIFHALNQKATARRFASEIGKSYEDIKKQTRYTSNLLGCH